MILTAQVYEIQGVGEFRFENAGQIVYSARASLEIQNGFIVNEKGYRLSPPVRVAGQWSITPDGKIVCEGRTAGEVVLARLQDGRRLIGAPAQEGFGKIRRAAANARIRIRPVSEVATDMVTLGQIGEISGIGSDLVVCESPKVGEDRLITKLTIASCLRAAKLDPASVSIEVPENSIVRRSTNTIKAQDIESFARNWIAQQLPEAGELSLVTKIVEKEIPSGECVLQVTSHRELASAVILSIEGKAGKKTLFGTQLVFNRGPVGAKLSSAGPKIGQNVRILLLSNGVSVEAVGKIQKIEPGGSVSVVVEETKASLVGILRPDGIVEVKL